MNIIIATHQYLTQVKTLYHELIITYPESFLLTEKEESTKEEIELNRDKGFILLALEGEKSIGMIECKFGKYEKRSHTCSIEKFGVLPDHKGKGVGKQLLQKCLEKIIVLGTVHRIELFVHDTSEEAMSLYKHFGFIEEGKLKEVIFYNNKFHDVYIMAKILPDN